MTREEVQRIRQVQIERKKISDSVARQIEKCTDLRGSSDFQINNNLRIIIDRQLSVEVHYRGLKIDELPYDSATSIHSAIKRKKEQATQELINGLTDEDVDYASI